MMMATAAAVAIVVFSCKSKLSEAERLDLRFTPIQTVDSMYILQTKDGHVEMRVEAPVMERYETDTMSYELFPKGLDVYGYTEQGELQSEIHSENASHEKYKSGGEEIWKAFGNVVIRNVMKQETMETDTIYWDRKAGEIYTDCYVRMYSPDGFLQGYGMRSDEKVTNSVIMRPFNSYGVVVQDSTQVRIDTANFIGPLLKKSSR
jgi:hypothetical protein